jgi:hypothetical protein
MSEQPPKDLGATDVLVVVAVVLIIIITAVVVLVYDRSSAPQHRLERLTASLCVQEPASSVSSRTCPALLSQVPASRRQ